MVHGLAKTHQKSKKLHRGIYINDSKMVVIQLSQFFLLLKEDKATMDYGEVYCLTLMYSQPPRASGTNAYDHVHIQCGINPIF